MGILFTNLAGPECVCMLRVRDILYIHHVFFICRADVQDRYRMEVKDVMAIKTPKLFPPPRCQGWCESGETPPLPYSLLISFDFSMFILFYNPRAYNFQLDIQSRNSQIPSLILTIIAVNQESNVLHLKGNTPRTYSPRTPEKIIIIICPKADETTHPPLLQNPKVENLDYYYYYQKRNSTGKTSEYPS